MTNSVLHLVTGRSKEGLQGFVDNLMCLIGVFHELLCGFIVGGVWQLWQGWSYE